MEFGEQLLVDGTDPIEVKDGIKSYCKMWQQAIDRVTSSALANPESEDVS